MKVLVLFSFFVFVASVSAECLFNDVLMVNPGPKFPPTKGEVWPEPQNENKTELFYSYSPNVFSVKVTNKTCKTLNKAISRLEKVVKNLYNISRRMTNRHDERAPCDNGHLPSSSKGYQGHIQTLLVELNKPCEAIPYFNMTESYQLTIATTSILRSDSIWGIMLGLETISQLFYLSDDYTDVRINENTIVDFPSYPHRGLLLDTSRHYISPETIMKTLDAMAMNKMNVFHWHIVDDQSFPYQSSTFPELSAQGAYHPTLVYTESTVKSIIEYATERGIRVLPEFDVPGHTRSWGVSHPEILTECYADCEEGEALVGLGPLHPLRKITYKIIRDLFDELQTVFPDSYFHIGGDEVDLQCWNSNPDIHDYMVKHNMTNIQQVHAKFILKVLSLLDRKTTPIVWQEVFDNNVALPKNSIIQIWKTQFVSEMVKTLNSGQRIILSAPWYLDNLRYTFPKMYSLPPREWVRGIVDDDKLVNVVGGEACMWGEMVDDTNVLARTWPRASAVAELVWRGAGGRRAPAPGRTLRRAEEHTCRMRRRGLPAEPPTGPGFCIL